MMHQRKAPTLLVFAYWLKSKVSIERLSSALFGIVLKASVPKGAKGWSYNADYKLVEWVE